MKYIDLEYGPVTLVRIVNGRLFRTLPVLRPEAYEEPRPCEGGEEIPGTGLRRIEGGKD